MCVCVCVCVRERERERRRETDRFYMSSLSPLAEVPRAAFSSLAHAISRVHDLKLPNDKHSRNEILCSYVQYMFTAPEPHSNSAAFDARGTFYRTRGPSSGEDDLKRSASLRHGKNVISMLGKNKQQSERERMRAKMSIVF